MIEVGTYELTFIAGISFRIVNPKHIAKALGSSIKQRLHGS